MKTQSERRQPCEGREDANDQVEIVFGFASDWFRIWHEISGQISE